MVVRRLHKYCNQLEQVVNKSKNTCKMLLLSMLFGVPGLVRGSNFFLSRVKFHKELFTVYIARTLPGMKTLITDSIATLDS